MLRTKRVFSMVFALILAVGLFAVPVSASTTAVDTTLVNFDELHSKDTVFMTLAEYEEFSRAASTRGINASLASYEVYAALDDTQGFLMRSGNLSGDYASVQMNQSERDLAKNNNCYSWKVYLTVNVNNAFQIVVTDNGTGVYANNFSPRVSGTFSWFYNRVSIGGSGSYQVRVNQEYVTLNFIG